MKEFSYKQDSLPEIVHLSSGFYTVRAWPQRRTKDQDSSIVYFEIFEALEIKERPDGAFIPVSWEDENGQIITELEEHKPTHWGSVKWDGCCDWHLGYQHQCSREGNHALGEVMTLCYDWAFVLMRRDNPGLSREQNDANFIATGEPYDAADDDILITDCLSIS